MLRLAHASESSGAKVADQLVSLAENELSLDEASTNERLARLPIKMLFPLALLILPGFLLVTVAPAVVSGISKLGL
jgi:pilus assembly protein TadC